jgi:hypothetical protein
MRASDHTNQDQQFSISVSGSRAYYIAADPLSIRAA